MTFFAWTTLLAEASPQGTQPNPTAQTLHLLGTMVFVFVVMYLILFRPQQKKAKEHERLLKTLKPKDKVVTTGGILGIIVSVQERTVTIRSADTKLEVLKSAVSEITERASGEA